MIAIKDCSYSVLLLQTKITPENTMVLRAISQDTTGEGIIYPLSEDQMFGAGWTHLGIVCRRRCRSHSLQ